MKQTYSLIVAFFFTAIAFAQQPIITAIVDGDCTGGTPKLLEIYAEGTVDFTQFSLQNQTNANVGDFGSTFSLADFGTVTDDFIYVTTNVSDGNSNKTALDSEFPNIDPSKIKASSVTNFNGDDRVRIINSTTMAVVDQFGVSDVRGTGEAWEYTDSYAKRKDGLGPNPNFNISEWDFGGVRFFDGKGTCQGGADTFATLMGGVATYTTVADTNPSLTITSPADNSTLNDGTLTATLSVSNFNVAASGSGDGYIVYQLDTNTAVDKFDTTPISISSIAPGNHVLTVKLVDNTGADLAPAVSQTLNFTVPSQIAVNSIAELRSQNADGSTIYTLNSEVLITHTESFRNQKWIEDSSAAILIDDQPGVITTALTRGDRISGISGTLSEFNGLLQFSPSEDPGAPTSSGNTVTPQAISLNALALNPEDYESELVSVSMVSFTNADGTIVFENGADLAIDNGVELFTHRSFFGKDYIGEVVPSSAGVLTGVVVQNTSRTEAYAISPRDAADIGELTLSTSSLNKVEFSLYPNPATTGTLNINSSNGAEFDVEVYSTLGQRVISQKAVTNTINIDSLTTGLYIVKISQGDASQTRKLVVK